MWENQKETPRLFQGKILLIFELKDKKRSKEMWFKAVSWAAYQAWSRHVSLHLYLNNNFFFQSQISFTLVVSIRQCEARVRYGDPSHKMEFCGKNDVISWFEFFLVCLLFILLLLLFFALVSCKKSALLVTITEIYKLINLTSYGKKMTLQTGLHIFSINIWFHQLSW